MLTRRQILISALASFAGGTLLKKTEAATPKNEKHPHTKTAPKNSGRKGRLAFKVWTKNNHSRHFIFDGSFEKNRPLERTERQTPINKETKRARGSRIEGDESGGQPGGRQKLNERGPGPTPPTAVPRSASDTPDAPRLEDGTEEG